MRIRILGTNAGCKKYSKSRDKNKIKFITEDHQKIIKRQFLFCILDQDPAIFFPGSSLGKIIDPDLVCAKRIDSDLHQYQTVSVTLIIYKQSSKQPQQAYLLLNRVAAVGLRDNGRSIGATDAARRSLHLNENVKITTKS